MPCFVDLRKAFNSVWHDGLYLKLLHYGITGNLYNTNKSMYSKLKYKVKTNGGVTDSFQSNLGVKSHTF